MKRYCVAILLALSLPFSIAHAKNDFANLSAELKSVADNALSEMAMEVAIKINLSGTQSMLVQKIVKEALLVTLAIDLEENKTNLNDSIDRFENILVGFQTEDEELKITQTQSKKVLEQMTKVAGLWDAFKATVNKIDTNKATIDKVRTTSLPLLEASEQLGKMFGAYCGENLNELATIINLTGKQRMLTQQMSAEFFLIANNKEKEDDKSANQIKLKKSLQQFDDLLTDLVKGNKQQKIPTTTDKAILEQLGKVRTQWEDFKPLLETVDSSSNKEALQKVATMNLTLLAMMNKVGEMYIQ